ncbi:bestrophin-1 [Eurytemora carolleeae]|uniref:bestrophin-1 n=1 Tax=Eurytemora carolleeae TaxID=1294199 RepID=UPI000C77198C|nr:bestrophin-1 [Eurytemora carolleeae]XP_023337746.1 bestrophin-1 [Eurytemora carolleeae]|eukprot:XP_023337745.1 bestrophin-1-like [Eurytemora affinis]
MPKRTNISDLLLGESRVMCRWRSSLWKLLWRELLLYTLAYLGVSCIYRFALSEVQQFEFERLVSWCSKQYTGLPLTFLLGFYVSLVVKRWWEQYCKLPWPDNIASYLRGLCVSKDEKAKIIRRTVVRYTLLSYILCIRRLSVRLRKRFPTMKEVVNSGLVRQEEADRIGDEDNWDMYASNWAMPLQWSLEIVHKAQQDGYITSAPGYVQIITQINIFRSKLNDVSAYGHIPVPLVYTQVVTLAVYIYFIVALVGEQWKIYRKPGDELDLWYPIFTTIKFLFYFGWLRVAETLYNPFGEDDDDFELNVLFNRHVKVALSLVDETESPPELRKDAFWGQPFPDIPDNVEETYTIVEDGKDGKESNIETNEMIVVTEHSPDEALTNAEKRDPMR